MTTARTKDLSYPGARGRAAAGPKNNKPEKTKLKNPVISMKLVIICLAIIIFGLVLATNAAGYINVRASLTKIPMVGKLFGPKGIVSEELATKTNSLEQDMANLQAKVKQQDDLLKGLLEEKQTLEQEKQAALKQIKDLQAQLQAEQTRRLGFKDMARYYGQMKPATAAAIMDKQDEQTVIGILQEMSPEQVARVLGAMKPERAAVLVNQMLK